MSPTDRRRHPRVRDPDIGATLVTPRGQWVSCAVRDLSAGGARLITSIALAPGDRVRVVLGHRRSGSSLMLDSTILRSERIDERWTMVAVTFDVAPDPVREAIRGLVLRALERQRSRARSKQDSIATSQSQSTLRSSESWCVRPVSGIVRRP